jgi:hypothetical protein
MESPMSECPQEAEAVRGLMTAARTRWRRLTDSVFGRDIALVLALKVALIVALYVFLFRPALHPAQDPAATAAAVAGAAAATIHEVQ